MVRKRFFKILNYEIMTMTINTFMWGLTGETNILRN